MSLLAVPVLAVLDPVFVPGPAVAAGLVLSVLIVGREPAPVDRRLVWAVAGLVPGTFLAVLLLAVVPSDLGFLASGPRRPVVDRGRTRPAVLSMSALAGVVALVQGLSG